MLSNNILISFGDPPCILKNFNYIQLSQHFFLLLGIFLTFFSLLSFFLKFMPFLTLLLASHSASIFLYVQLGLLSNLKSHLWPLAKLLSKLFPLYSYAWSYNICERGSHFCRKLIARKRLGFLSMFLNSYASFSVLFLYPLVITVLFFLHSS